MIKSMTGFASVTREDESASVGVTLKAVNSRFLDLQLRMPASLAPLEPRIRSAIQGRVARGRVEVIVTLQQRRQAAVEIELNEAFLVALREALDRARELGVIDGGITPGDLVRLPQALTIH